MITKEQIDRLDLFCIQFLNTVSETFDKSSFECSLEMDRDVEVLAVHFPEADTSAYVYGRGESSWFSMGIDGNKHVTLNVPGRIIVGWGSEGAHCHFDELTLEGIRIAAMIKDVDDSLPGNPGQWLIDQALMLVKSNFP